MSCGNSVSLKRFSDFAVDDRPLAGEKVKIEEILNREIVITGYKMTDSKFRGSNSHRCLTLQFEMEGRQYVLFTGSSVLINQMEKYGNEIPFMAIIKKIDRYFIMT